MCISRWKSSVKILVWAILGILLKFVLKGWAVQCGDWQTKLQPNWTSAPASSEYSHKFDFETVYLKIKKRIKVNNISGVSGATVRGGSKECGLIRRGIASYQSLLDLQSLLGDSCAVSFMLGWHCKHVSSADPIVFIHIVLLETKSSSYAWRVFRLIRVSALLYLLVWLFGTSC